MNEGLIPARYAKALLEHAASRGADEKVYTLMLRLADSFAEEPKLQQVMANPFIPAADKVSLLATAAGADPKDDPVYARFTGLLAENGRLALAREAALAYIGLYRKAHGIHRVVVTSAAPMPAPELERLKATILKHLDGGSMELTQKVDPDLIGGFTVAVDNERLDASVAGELSRLRQKLVSI